jgi:predicted RNase H-like nuclease (RuvC/YqgF family)
MSQVYNPESNLMAEIERMERSAADLRRRIEHARTQQDKRVLNRQLQEIEEDIQRLQTKLH